MEGAGAGMVLVDPEEREYSHAIHLNLHASEEDMDYEALLAGLIASTRRGMKDLHVFVDSRLLVDQAEGNRIPRTEGAIRYMEEIMDATAPFHRFRITYLPKALNPKAEALMGLTSIQLEFLNQEVSTGGNTIYTNHIDLRLGGNVCSKQTELKRSKEFYQTPQLVSEPRGS
ncbi:reverse transcriptase domain-containing protein [Tanacetum coccineum]